MSFVGVINVASSADQLIGTGCGVIDRLKFIFEQMHLQEDVRANKLRELAGNRLMIETVREEPSLQTANVLAALERFRLLDSQLDEVVARTNRARQGSMGRFGQEVRHGRSDRDELDEITQAISSIKTELSMYISVAHVGLTRQVGNMILVSNEEIRRVNDRLERNFGPGNGLRISALFRDRSVNAHGLIELSEADIALISSDTDTLIDGEPQKLEQIIIGNVTKDTAHQINGSVGEKQWLNLARLVIKNNRASGNSVQVNGNIDKGSFAALLQSRERTTGRVAPSKNRVVSVRK